MTTPLQPHGTYARANGRPSAGIKSCPCKPCRDAYNGYRKRRHVLNLTGRTLTVDAAPVARHVRMLLDAGTGRQHLADTADTSVSTIQSLVSGKTKTIRRDIAERILALRPDPAATTSTSALGSVRRIRALVAHGHQLSAIADAAGLDAGLVGDLANGRFPRVRHHTAWQIDDAYRRLRARPGGNVRSVNRARREGWPTPDEWAGDIDDPDVDPATWERRNELRHAADLAEDAAFIQRTTGMCLDLVAERLGVSRNYLDKARERTAARQRQAA